MKAKKKRIIVRMCVHCRVRFAQNELYRLQYIQQSPIAQKKIMLYSGQGRSFYLCCECVSHRKVAHSLCRVCKVDKKGKDDMDKNLKEAICQQQK